MDTLHILGGTPPAAAADMVAMPETAPETMSQPSFLCGNVQWGPWLDGDFSPCFEQTILTGVLPATILIALFVITYLKYRKKTLQTTSGYLPISADRPEIGDDNDDDEYDGEGRGEEDSDMDSRPVGKRRRPRLLMLDRIAAFAAIGQLGLSVGMLVVDVVLKQTAETGVYRSFGEFLWALQWVFEQMIFKEPSPTDLPDVFNDLDYDYLPDDNHVVNDVANKKKLREIIDKTSICLINELRPGKGMLVLDLDYTLFDCKSSVSHISEVMRPGMHELLTAAYQYYDICIWSQTAWKYLEMKITELGILLNPAYRIAFVLDRTAMFSITSTTRRHDGQPVKHQVKALEIIWSKFPHLYSAT
ncbi:Ubiquitin-like domain-containing CTD phosphatase 1, partial [Borealophlyctis nickersoniae]